MSVKHLWWRVEQWTPIACAAVAIGWALVDVVF